MSEREGKLSGGRFNRIRDALVGRYYNRVDFFVDGLLEDGYPPFHDPLSPREQYDRLVSWRQAGDPRFWRSAAAQAALAQLAAEMGPPPPIMPPSPGGPLARVM
ncbi:MAG: hypothetical protein NUW01_15850 [Gemmatimonadaceae bacterium]|nr:hypothetical protein [Gemmatimonadaceae bacterium]